MYTNRWKIKKIRYIDTRGYYPAIKKNEIVPFAATWMDLEFIILGKVNQKKNAQTLYGVTYMGNLNKWYRWTYLWVRNKLEDIENKVTVTKGERGEWEVN